MYLPTLAPQRSVLKATFLSDHEILHESGDVLNVYHQSYVTRLIPTSKRKRSRVSWISVKVICFMAVDGASAVVSARNHFTWSNPGSPDVAYSVSHKMSVTGFACYLLLHRFLILKSAVFIMPFSHISVPGPSQ